MYLDRDIDAVMRRTSGRPLVTGIIELLLITTVPTMVLAADGWPPLGLMLVTLLGIWVYVTWYINSPKTTAEGGAQAQPVAQQNQLIVPMANFTFNPKEVVLSLIHI